MFDEHYDDRAERAAPGLHPDAARFLDGLGLVSGRTVVDVGAGTGSWARRMLAMGATHVSAVEWGAIASDDPRLQSYRRNLNDAGWEAGIDAADLVTCLEVVEHIPNQLILLQGIRALLAPGGKALVSTPNLETPRTRLRLLLTGKLKEFDPHGDPTHLIPVFIHPFTKVCRMAGLRVDQVWSSPATGSLNVGWRGRWLDRIFRLFGARFVGDSLCFVLSSADERAPPSE